MQNRSYTVGEMKNIIKESTNEFKAVLGSKVEGDNKKNNEKAYADIKKNVSAYDGGLRPSTKKTKGDNILRDGLGMQDLRYEKGSASKDFKERVKSQMKGYVSKEAEKLHKDDEFGNADYGFDFDEVEKKAKQHSDNVTKSKEIGLTGREMKGDFKKNAPETVFETKKIKKLHFKNTEFLSEEHMKSRIPEEFKTEGNKFIVKDRADNEFLIEWSYNQANILKHTNKTMVNEQLDRIKELFNYNSKDRYTNYRSNRINEDDMCKKILDDTRLLRE